MRDKNNLPISIFSPKSPKQIINYFVMFLIGLASGPSRVCASKISYKDKEVYNIVYGTWWDLHIADVEKQLKDYRYILKALDFRGNMSKSHITDQHIIEAKQKPITDYVQFNKQGFARCIAHEEKTGSLKYYPETNTCYCFGGCQKSFDVIDVVRKQNDLNFIQAVKFILNI